MIDLGGFITSDEGSKAKGENVAQTIEKLSPRDFMQPEVLLRE